MRYWYNREKPKEDERMREIVKEMRDSLQISVTSYLRDSIPVQMTRQAELLRLETVINNYYKEQLDETTLYTPSQLDSALLSRFAIDLGRYQSERTPRSNGRSKEGDFIDK